MNLLGRILLVVLCLSILGCTSAHERVRRDLEWSEQAFQRGEVFEAYRRLKGVVQVDLDLAQEYQTLNQQVTAAVEYLIEQWVSRAEAARAAKDLVRARTYLGDLIALLPPADPLKVRIVENYSKIDDELREIRSRIDGWILEGRKAFLSGVYSRARDELERALAVARVYRLPMDLATERMAEEARRRAPAVNEPPGYVEPGPSAEPEPQPLARKEPKEKISVRRPPRPEHPRGPATSPPAEKAPDPAEPMLDRARERLAKNDLVGAISALRDLLRQFPEHPQALELLRSLEPQRKRLLEELGRRAAEFFAREDLEQAAPLYRDILVLDPGNLRAKEGLQMHKKFIELKQKQR